MPFDPYLVYVEAFSRAFVQQLSLGKESSFAFAYASGCAEGYVAGLIEGFAAGQREEQARLKAVWSASAVHDLEARLWLMAIALDDPDGVVQQTTPIQQIPN